MALITSGVISGVAAGSKTLGISGGDVASFFGFGGGGGKDRRRKIRESLKSAGFTYNNNHSGRWNINKFGDQALQNVVQLYKNYGNYAVQLHNDRKLSNAIAEDYARMERMVKDMMPADGSGIPNMNIGSSAGGGSGPAGVPGWVWGAAGLIGLAATGFIFLK